MKQKRIVSACFLLLFFSIGWLCTMAYTNAPLVLVEIQEHEDSTSFKTAVIHVMEEGLSLASSSLFMKPSAEDSVFTGRLFFEKVPTPPPEYYLCVV